MHGPHFVETIIDLLSQPEINEFHSHLNNLIENMLDEDTYIR